jgi:hypothetical protein
MSDANDVTPAAAQRCLERLRSGYERVAAAIAVPTTGCLLHCKSPSEARYPKTKIQGAGERKEYYIHHLVLRGKGAAIDAALQVSHLCHNKRCINPDHIIAEPGEYNRMRQGCTQLAMLRHTCSHCGVAEWINPCPHEPACVIGYPN